MLPLSCSVRHTHSSTSRLASSAPCTAQRVTRGLSFASFGKSHSCETPTTWSISPSAAAISVAAGNSETMRCTHKHTRCMVRSNRDRAPHCHVLQVTNELACAVETTQGAAEKVLCCRARLVSAPARICLPVSKSARARTALAKMWDRYGELRRRFALHRQRRRSEADLAHQ